MKTATAVAWLALAAVAAGQSPTKTIGLPDDGKLLGAAITNVEGRWMVIQSTPFRLITDVREVRRYDIEDGQQVFRESVVFFQGDTGEYIAICWPNDTSQPYEYASIVLGDGEPDPEIDLSLTVPDEVGEGDEAQGNVTNSASSDPLTVNLSSDTSRLQVPRSVVTPPGAFALTAPNNEDEDGDLAAVITALAQGVKASASVLIKDDDEGLPPGNRRIIVIAQSDDSGPARTIALRMLREWCESNDHQYRGPLDPDMDDVDPDDKDDLVAYLSVLEREGISQPAMLIVADIDGQQHYVAYPFPDVGNTPSSGRVAGEEAIGLAKEHTR